jgi:hypothetical protein
MLCRSSAFSQALDRSAKYGGKWQPDADASACACCDKSFSFVHRRHHCRSCLLVVCSKCSPHKAVHARTQKLERQCVDCLVSTETERKKEEEEAVLLKSTQLARRVVKEMARRLVTTWVARTARWQKRVDLSRHSAATTIAALWRGWSTRTHSSNPLRVFRKEKAVAFQKQVMARSREMWRQYRAAEQQKVTQALLRKRQEQREKYVAVPSTLIDNQLFAISAKADFAVSLSSITAGVSVVPAALAHKAGIIDLDDEPTSPKRFIGG